MGLLDKLKNKLYPEEKEVLYYDTSKEKKEEKKKEQLTNQIINVKPQSFSETESLCDSLKNGNTIILDISDLSKADALRMIDFLGGVMYALDGDMKRINKDTFEYKIHTRKK